MSHHGRSGSLRMMRRKSVGVNELKTRAAHIVREVRDSQASYLVTHRGRAVGVILPIDEPDSTSALLDDASAVAAWETFIQAGRGLERRFAPGVSGVELLSGSRR